MQQLPTIDRTLLNDEQRAELDAYLEMFQSAGWRQLERRVTPAEAGYRNLLEHAENLVEIGRVQGALRMIRELVTELPQRIQVENLSATGQLRELMGDEQGPSETDPVQPGDWRA